jgi:ABC-type Mn2+/Zn2+ transport system ATPase subunit
MARRFALLGPNGAGKSTTIDMVLGLSGYFSMPRAADVQASVTSRMNFA